MNTKKPHRGKVIGMRLKAAREKLHLSPDEVAHHFNVTARTVLNWEMGRAIPNAERLSQLTEYYDISVDDLIDKGLSESRSFRNQYIVVRRDGESDAPHEKYFVLRVSRDPHSRRAIMAYQQAVKSADPTLAEEIAIWLSSP